jgi:hypothetical protein
VKNIVNILLFSFHSVYLTTSAKYMAWHDCEWWIVNYVKMKCVCAI